MATSAICSIPDCGKQSVNIRGWCNAHYLRFLRHGHPEGGRALNGAHQAFLEEAVQYEGHECLLWPFDSKTPGGYGVMWHNGKRNVVSRLICERAHGAPPTHLHEAAHSCGNGSNGCCTKRHLSWKTRRGNQNDRVLHGTTNRGERCGSAKLSAENVRTIRSLADRMMQKDIAARFGVTQGSISEIINRKKWIWLD